MTDTPDEVFARYMPRCDAIGEGLTIVCGPPQSGKTTYAKTLHCPVIDLDDFKDDFDGLVRAFEHRDQLLMDYEGERVTLIIGAPWSWQRREMRSTLQPGRVVVLETPAAICKQRLNDSDGSQYTTTQARIEIEAAIDRWWHRYSIDIADDRIR